MITLAWYLLKVIICSGILCGYYFLSLRNKVFHRWNRFYLLAAFVISLIVPLMKINIFQNNEDKGAVVQMLQTISYGDEAVIEYSRNNGFQISSENLAEAAYLLVSVILLTIFFVSLYKIKRLKKKYPETKIEDISFINTNAKGTPFSFFKSIFWNNAIDLHSKPGQQIFNHEIAHIKEKHSYDKIFMNLVLIFFWINPFFWLMRKELYMIHEFIADKEALEDSDINAFAEMILQTVYPGQNFSISNSFFYSPLKRRIMMLTKNKNPKVSYLSRLLVLPLAAIVFFAFTLKVNSTNEINSYSGKTITVVIDAGHGGSDNGATSADGLKEKDITLSIAKKIAAINSNDHIQILLSRNNDQSVSVKDRVLFAKENSADLFISLHVNKAVNQQLNGFSVLIDKNNSEQNQLLASALIKELKRSYKTSDKIAAREKFGVWVLDHNVCPAALIECGYLSNSTDAKFISNSDDQEKVAKNIMDGINNYAASLQNNANNITPISLIDNSSIKNSDTIPPMYYKGKKVKNLEVQSSSKKIKVTAPVIKVTFVDGTSEMISKEEADKNHLVLPPPPPPGLPPSYFKSKALFVIDGQISTNKKAKEVNPKSIKSINILKDDEAIKKYGEKGKNGVIELTTKNNDDYSLTGTTDKLYISGSSSKPFSENSKITANAIYIHSIPNGVLIFVDGKEISKDEMKNIPPNSMRSINVLKSETAEKKYGAKGKNGAIEITTKKIGQDSTITKTYFKFAEKDTVPDKVFTKVEITAQFPGGQQAWFKYIVKEIQASIDSFTQADYGTCVVRFIVDVDGTVRDVIPTTMQGTRLAKTAVNAIKNGPKWIPAQQNGHYVAAYRLQPVTLQSPNEKTPSDNLEKNKKSTTLNTENDRGKVFIKLDQHASFPGGQSAWLKYISRVITKHGNELIAGSNNSGSCKVRFIVDENGKVSDVRATTMKGTALAEVAVNAIKEGPDWIPGKQNGHAVNSFIIIPVGFSLSDEITAKGQILKVTH